MSTSNLKRKLDLFDGIDPLIPNRSQFLNEKLSHRPDRQQLVEQGILHESQCAPSLQFTERALKRARLADELNNHLVNRPGPLELVKNKILHVNTTEHPHLEQAIQGGQIPFKPTRSSSRRPLIFHEYTGPPSSCKPKVTKIESLSSSSSTHEIRLAQQELLLELTSDKPEEDQPLLNKSLEEMTKGELRDLCKQYQIPSSHTNKTKLIERIKQTQNQIHNQGSNVNELLQSNSESISSLKISDSPDIPIEPFTTNELDEILKTIPISYPTREDDSSTNNFTIDFDLSNHLFDSSLMNNDDLFVQMLLDNDNSLNSTNSPTNLPRITSVDEFDAFLRDFTENYSSYSQQTTTTS